MGLASATSLCHRTSIASSEEGLRTHAVTAMLAEGSSNPLSSTTQFQRQVSGRVRSCPGSEGPTFRR